MACSATVVFTILSIPRAAKASTILAHLCFVAAPLAIGLAKFRSKLQESYANSNKKITGADARIEDEI